ncbi:pickpocket protein 28-like [Folsomia candida]|uniref:pickpocket protein 28-like n=1 Tax=Folsomia candida TaxID=158441 RepID=UPI000B8FA494|nr:pickpocket protein 28-like [Folsomia candida]
MRRNSRHCLEEYAMDMGAGGEVAPDPIPPPPPPARRDHVAIDMLEECCAGSRSRCESVIRSECQPNGGDFLVQALQNLPGFRECLAKDMHISMRVFWAIVIALLSAIVYVIVRMGMTRTMGHPLVINPETEETYIGNVIYPRITIAPHGGFNLNQIDDAFINYLDVQSGHNIDWTHKEATGVLQIIDQVCSPNTTFAGLNNVRHEDDTNWALGDDLNATEKVMDKELQTSGRVVQFIRGGMVSCSDAIQRCFLNGVKLDCGEVFKEHFSEWGSTCVFNGIPTAATRSHETLQSTFGHQYKDDELAEWQQVKSDRDSDTVAEKGQNRTIPIPWKQYFPGKTSGLTFVIRQQSYSEKACVHGEGVGFMVGVNHPFDEPQIQRFGVPIPFGVEAYVAVRPTVYLADGEIKEDVDQSNRRCYFSDEGGMAHLEYYKKYSKQNCLSECFSKKVTQRCNCTMLTYPGKPGHRLCTVKEMRTCVQEQEQALFKKGLATICEKCRPNCRDTKYETSISSSPMSNRKMKDWHIPKRSSFSVVHVYFETDSIQALRRSSRYNWFEVTGLNGGTISMVTGICLLDIVKGISTAITLLAGQYFLMTQQPDGGMDEETSQRRQRDVIVVPPPANVIPVQPRAPTPPPQYLPVEPLPEPDL